MKKKVFALVAAFIFVTSIAVMIPQSSQAYMVGFDKKKLRDNNPDDCENSGNDCDPPG